MTTALSIIQILISIALIAVVLLQQQGTGLGDAFGGGGGGAYRSKRGFERVLHRTTIVLAILFVASAIGSLFVH